jgi:hypothetical protein
MKKILPFLFAVLLLSVIAYAETIDVTEDVSTKTSTSGDFIVELTSLDNKIPLGGTAVIQMKITNNMNDTARYRLSFDNTGEWLYIRTDPVDHALTGMVISGGLSLSTDITLRAKEDTEYGTYFVKTTITNEATGENVVVLLPVGIKTEEELAGMRVPSIRVSMDVPPTIDPRAENFVTIYLLNKNNRDIQDMVIELESSLIGKKTVNETLGPNEEKEVKIGFTLDPLTKPQEDTMKGKITVAGYTFTPTAKSFQVSSYNTALNVEEDTKIGFLKSTKLITIENTGNDVISETVLAERGTIKNLFTTTEPEARIVEIEGEKYYSWAVNADPEVKSTIKVITSYQPLFWFIVFVIALLIIRYMIKSKVRVFKKCAGTETSEGGLSDIKIMLTVRNDTGKPIKDIEVKDIIPHIASIKREFPAGTIEPDKILMHKTKGTVVKWRIDELDAGEERIIKYDIKSKLNILGSFTLPSTKVKYKTITGRDRSSSGKKLVVGEEE